MLALHIAISPIYLMLILGLIARLGQFHFAIRLILAITATFLIAVLITFIQDFETIVSGVFIGWIVGAMLIISMVLLYPVLAKITPFIMGLPTTNKAGVRDNPVNIDASSPIEAIEPKHSPIKGRDYVLLLICCAIAVLLIGFGLRQLLQPKSFLSLMTLGALGLSAGLLTHRFIAAPLRSSKKVSIGWQRGFQLVCCICVSLLAGWMIASYLQHQDILESLIYGISIAITVPFGVFAWQVMLEGFEHLKR